MQRVIGYWQLHTLQAAQSDTPMYQSDTLTALSICSKPKRQHTALYWSTYFGAQGY